MKSSCTKATLAALAATVLSATLLSHGAFAAVPAAATSAPAATAASGAPDSGSHSESTDDEAHALFRRATAAFDEKRYADAEGLFAQAFALRKAPDIATNLGITELKLGKARAAAEHLQYALSLLPLTAKAEQRRAVEEKLGQARAEVGALTVRVSRAGADVLVDGISVGTAPLANSVFVDAGRHRIEARAGAEQSAPVTIDIGRGAEREVELELEGGSAPESNASPLPVVAGVGFGLGGAGLVAAIVLTAVANGKSTDRADASASLSERGVRCEAGNEGPECADARSTAKSLDTFSNAAMGTWIASGVVVLGTAIATAIVASSAEPKVAIAPIAGPGFAGLGAIGRF